MNRSNYKNKKTKLNSLGCFNERRIKLKKIFSILLCLAMLVSLAALTTAPVSAADPCVCPTLSPSSGTFDLTNPCPVAANIKLNDATSVTDVTFCNGTPLDSADWEVYSNCLLVITADFLSDVLTDCGDCVCLDVVFDVCVVNFVITATGKDATLTPKTAQWVLHSADDVLTTVTWNDIGNNVSGVSYTHPANPEDVEDLVYGVGYDVVDNGDGTGNLTILNGWLASELLTIGTTVKLVVDFDMCADATLTISCVAAPLPSLSPMKINYCIGCCQNVSTEIVWGNATGFAAFPSGVVDITTNLNNPLNGVPLVPGIDYWIDADHDTLILNGCKNATPDLGWGGLACSLDAGTRIANLIQITFNDVCHTKVILEIDSACYTVPSITPSDIVWDLDAVKADITGEVTAYAGAIVTLGTATGINHVEDLIDGLNLVEAGTAPPKIAQWMMAYAPAYGGWLLLLFRDSYINPGAFVDGLLDLQGEPHADLTAIGNSTTLLVYWDGGPVTGCVCALCSSFPYFYLPTEITITATGAGATISPTKADFNLDSPADIKTFVTWGNWASTVTAVMNGATSVPFTLAGDNLTIPASYLSSVLNQVGDQVVLTIKFDQGPDAKLTITATGTPLCFIATAAGANAPQLDVLRAFRDQVMRPNALGAKLISLYYAVSPSIAKVIAGNAALKWVVKHSLVDELAALLGAL
jgi:hypothetical protein